MSDLAKMELPNFIRTKAVVWYGDDDEPTIVECRINPFHISSYYENRLHHKGKTVKITVVYCGSATYNLEMSISEIDDMMENVDRGLSMKEG